MTNYEIISRQMYETVKTVELELQKLSSELLWLQQEYHEMMKDPGYTPRPFPKKE